MAYTYAERSQELEHEIDPNAYPIIPIYLHTQPADEVDDEECVVTKLIHTPFARVAYSIHFMDRFVISEGILPRPTPEQGPGTLTYYGPPDEELQIHFVIHSLTDAVMSIFHKEELIESKTIHASASGKLMLHYHQYLTVKLWIIEQRRAFVQSPPASPREIDLLCDSD